MPVDYMDRLQSLNDAIRDLEEAILKQSPKKIVGEARFCKAILTQIEYEAEREQTRKQKKP